MAHAALKHFDPFSCFVGISQLHFQLLSVDAWWAFCKVLKRHWQSANNDYCQASYVLLTFLKCNEVIQQTKWLSHYTHTIITVSSLDFVRWKKKKLFIYVACKMTKNVFRMFEYVSTGVQIVRLGVRMECSFGSTGLQTFELGNVKAIQVQIFILWLLFMHWQPPRADSNVPVSLHNVRKVSFHWFV